MASQLTVWRINSLTGAGITGEVVRVYDPTITTMKASTEGGEQGGGVLAIVDNGNGSYTVAAGLAYQTIAIAFNSTTAAETGYENIQWDGDDVHTHLDNLTKHRLINDSGTTTTVLLSASKIIATYLAKTDIDGTTVGLNGDGELEVKDSGIGNDKLGTAAVETINVKDANITVAKINYDTNDFEADGTKLSIKQDFSNDIILDEDRTLNQNLSRLERKIIEIEGSVGGIKRRILYSDFERATGATNNEAVDYRTYGVDVNVYKTILRIPYLKQNGDLTMNIYFYSTGDSSATGLFTLNYGGSDVIEKGMGDGLGDGVISYDISGEPNGALTAILLKLKTNSDGHEVFVSKIIIEITSGE